VDEDLQAKRLVGLLRTAGHDVMTATEAGLEGASDESVLSRAHCEGRAVLTRNVDHFRDMHDSGSSHSGILAVFEGRQARKNMSRSDIVRAIGNLETAGLEITGQFVVLNAWKR
jgi:hypothetical protein